MGIDHDQFHRETVGCLAVLDGAGPPASGAAVPAPLRFGAVVLYTCDMASCEFSPCSYERFRRLDDDPRPGGRIHCPGLRHRPRAQRRGAPGPQKRPSGVGVDGRACRPGSDRGGRYGVHRAGGRGGVPAGRSGPQVGPFSRGAARHDSALDSHCGGRRGALGARTGAHPHTGRRVVAQGTQRGPSGKYVGRRAAEGGGLGAHSRAGLSLHPRGTRCRRGSVGEHGRRDGRAAAGVATRAVAGGVAQRGAAGAAGVRGAAPGRPHLRLGGGAERGAVKHASPDGPRRPLHCGSGRRPPHPDRAGSHLVPGTGLGRERAHERARRVSVVGRSEPWG